MIEERPGAEPGYRFFALGVRQRVDHTDPGAGTFEQRLTLLHTATDRPTVPTAGSGPRPGARHRPSPRRGPPCRGRRGVW
ncbi:hypothetical protein [Streptomyces viridochromogenes]|uniref:hypothetical protein n=1 Tax=Streptomyces viridochromogenes TaxID=1938 RepID=UPI001F1D711E|nr:hypothetical protein [Streptomyces viridochromogenes]